MSQKSQLHLLTAFLVTSMQPAIQVNQVDAWQEGGQLILNGEDKGEGYLLAKWKYNAVISIENFPYRKVNAYNILAMVAAFLIDSGWERDTYGLSDPDIDVDVGSDSANVLIELQLMDDLEVIPDPDGPIAFNGQNYRIDLVMFNIAEEFELRTSVGDE